MAVLIDWHSHHAPPELVGPPAPGGRGPDPYDSADVTERIAALDAAGIETQLVSPGRGAIPQGGADGMMDAIRAYHNAVADWIEEYPDRLIGNIAISFLDIADSVAEIERMAGRGFKAIFLNSRPDMIGRPEVEPLFAKINELQLPILLHGGGGGGISREGLDLLEDGGQGVSASVHGEAVVADCAIRMIAAGFFDRYPNLQIVIRSGGAGVPLLLNRLYWQHQAADGVRSYKDILLDHFLVDTANTNPRAVQFSIDVMGEGGVVFGSDFGGGLGPIERALVVVDEQPDPDRVKSITERNARRLLHL